jgi:hypothetical protein
MDSRLRGNDKPLPRVIPAQAGIQRVAVRPINVPSLPRRRESMPARLFVAPLDSRLRGNDETFPASFPRKRESSAWQCAQSTSCHSRESGNPCPPACSSRHWIPACAGMTKPSPRHSREGGNPCPLACPSRHWIPAYAGITKPFPASFPRRRESSAPSPRIYFAAGSAT